MELFPAANDDQWTLIKQVIDDCDYYIVIVGGRYGSTGPNEVSYTEMEYRYALEREKPIIAFLHRDPGTLAANRTEPTPEGKQKLQEFRDLTQRKMVKFWTSPADLGSVVSRSLTRLIKTEPAVGWVKANEVPSESASKEILRLKRQIEELEASLISARTQAPEGTQDLAQGNDELDITYTFEASFPENYLDEETYRTSFTTTWNQLFSMISPWMINEVNERALRANVNKYISDSNKRELSGEDYLKGKIVSNFSIEDADYQTIKIQLRALGLIEQSDRSRSVKDTSTYWTLTPYGDSVMTKLRAIRKPLPTASSD